MAFGDSLKSADQLQREAVQRNNLSAAKTARAQVRPSMAVTQPTAPAGGGLGLASGDAYDKYYQAPTADQAFKPIEYKSTYDPSVFSSQADTLGNNIEIQRATRAKQNAALDSSSNDYVNDTSQFDLARKRAAQTNEVQSQARRDALAKRFNALGNLDSGAALKLEQKAQGESEGNLNQAYEGINAQQQSEIGRRKELVRAQQIQGAQYEQGLQSGEEQSRQAGTLALLGIDQESKQFASAQSLAVGQYNELGRQFDQTFFGVEMPVTRANLNLQDSMKNGGSGSGGGGIGGGLDGAKDLPKKAGDAATNAWGKLSSIQKNMLAVAGGGVAGLLYQQEHEQGTFTDAYNSTVAKRLGITGGSNMIKAGAQDTAGVFTDGNKGYSVNALKKSRKALTPKRWP